MSAESDRLQHQLEFVVETDELKQVMRQTLLIRDRRRENDAEHSWHLGLMAIVFQEYAKGSSLDVLKVLKMLLIHDLVEIDAGDTFAYDEAGQSDRQERERQAAERIFNLLPVDQAGEFRALWEEFEHRKTPESRYANALDRLQPLLLNYHSGGATWRRNGVREKRVIARNRHIAQGAPALWDYAKEMIGRAVEEGKLER